ncbi:helix-turn-helix transcriptional regulator [Labilibacter sediminis]|nr:helix-turn-helix transcriptional regulator [Labilibacter sediminis]
MSTFRLKSYVIQIKLIGLFLLSAFATKGEEIILKRKGVVHNFTKQEYKAASQNWAISQNQCGEMFFGNTFGLLRYDGFTWSLHQLKSNNTVRSVFTDENGRVYVGGHEEFGYWEYSPEGVLLYHSISKTLPSSHIFKNEDIWSIMKIDEKIYFRSFAHVYVLHNENITIIDPNNAIFSMYEINNTPYVFLLNKGFHKITDDFLLEKDHVLSELDKKFIVGVGMLGNSWIIATDREGLFVFKEGILSKWDCMANQTLQNKRINNLICNNEKMVIGTISNGVFAFDYSGKLLTQLDKGNGLQNNTVLDLYIDLNNKLWVAMDKGIDRVDLDLPIDIYEDEKGNLGSVYASATINNQLFLSTNHGIYKTKWPISPLTNQIKLNVIPKTKGQSWAINKIDSVLFIGHNEGTFIVENNKISKISNISGGSNTTINPKNGMAYQGTYIGIAIYRKNSNGNWIFHKMLRYTSEPIRYLEFDHKGNLWASNIYKYLYKYKLNALADEIIETTRYGEEQGFNSDFDINTFKINDRIVFSNNKHFYTYDDINNTIIPFYKLESQLHDYADAQLLFNPTRDEYWFAKHTGLKCFNLVKDSLKSTKEIKYAELNRTSVDLNENISLVDSNKYILGLEDGFCIYRFKDISNANNFCLKIRSIITLTESGKEKPLPTLGKTINYIPYSFNNIKIQIAAPGIINQSLKFYYRLNDKDSWIPYSEGTLYVNNLKWGRYNISIKAIDALSKSEAIINYPVYIKKPSTLDPVAFVIYLAIILLAIYALRKISEGRLKQQKLLYLKKLRKDNQDHIKQMKNELLQTKVAHKSKELANYTMLLKRKNEVLTLLKEEISKFELTTTKDNILTKTKTLKIIDNNLSDKNDLDFFNLQFNEGHDNFMTKLKQKHPDLTPSDLRLCALLKMNLMSKEIAVLLNLSPRSVEVKRYRLRKKLNLHTEENLTTYLLQL